MSEDHGTWVVKNDPLHFCITPFVGNSLDLQFGDKSVWRCDCGIEWIWIANEKYSSLGIGDWKEYKNHQEQPQVKNWWWRRG